MSEEEATQAPVAEANQAVVSVMAAADVALVTVTESR